VRDLQLANFIVSENDVRQRISSFSREKAPANVVLVLDASPDVYAELDTVGRGDKPKATQATTPIVEKIFGPKYQPPPIRPDPVSDIASVRHAAKQVVARLRPIDRVSILQVGQKVELIQDWTSDREAADHAIDWRLKLAEGTSLWDAIYLAAHEKLAQVEGQRIVVVVGDGVDTASKITNHEASSALDRTGCSAYFVDTAPAAIRGAEKYLRDEGGVLAPRRRQANRAIDALRFAESGLRTMAERSGGGWFPLISLSDAERSAASVFADLEMAYVLSYVSSDARRDGAWRSVEVYFDRPGLVARTRRGYFATDAAVHASGPAAK